MVWQNPCGSGLVRMGVDRIDRRVQTKLWT
jgi:hypothetical protein